MDIDNEKKYCQSCGMPLDIEGISEYGTNSMVHSIRNFVPVV